MRTDDSFKEQTHQHHHIPNKESPLVTNLTFNMVSGYVIDYMHCVCICTIKRMLTRWRRSKANENKCHLGTNQDTIRNCFGNLSWTYSLWFSKKIQGGLLHFSHWNACEMRLMMVYVGIDYWPKNVFSYDVQYFFCISRLLWGFYCSLECTNFWEIIKNIIWNLWQKFF